jgi:hypothetical protein
MLLSASSYADLIGSVVTEGGPDSVCLVAVAVPWEIDGQKSFLPLGLCSGSLVAPNEVRASAHCVTAFMDGTAGKDAVIRVSCGYSAKALDGSLNFKAKRGVKEAYIARDYKPGSNLSDVLKLVLDEPIPSDLIPPMTIVKSVAEAEDLLKNAEICEVAGFGGPVEAFALRSGEVLDRDLAWEPKFKGFVMMTIGAIGESRGSPVDQKAAGKGAGDAFFGEAFLVELAKGENARVSSVSPTFVDINEPRIYSEESSAYWRKFASILKANFPFSLLMQPGDSGGPLYCRKNRTSTPTLVAINEGILAVLSFTDPTRRKLNGIMKMQIWAYPDADLVPVPGFVVSTP